MIIVDLSQVMISTLMVQIGNHHNIDVDENILRHMILNSIRSNKMKFGSEYGDFVIAADGKNSWRRSVYPYYKANRKKDRDASELNWTSIFEKLNKIRDEIKEFFPYRVIHLEGAEADDVIATLVKKYNNDKILILSGDKDFQQLQRYPNVKQFNPVMKKYITCKNPEFFLKEHIIRGDKGDGIPNFLSSDDTFVTNSRQKNISSKKISEWILKEPETYCNDTMLRNFKRNQMLIDFDYIPQEIEQSIMNEYESQAGKTRSKIFNYFVVNKLKNLMENINDF